MKWPEAPKDVLCRDVWPPGRLGVPERHAYERLSLEGRIVMLGEETDAAGRVCVRYRADIPLKWIREELRAAKVQGKQMEIEVGKDAETSGAASGGGHQPGTV